MTFNLKTLKGALLAGLLTFAAAHVGHAQQVSQMGTTELKDESVALVKENKYIEARPYIIELIKRISESEDQNLKKELEQLYYFRSYGYLQEYKATPDEKLLKKAIEGFDKVISEYPTGSFADSCIKMKAMCYEGMKNMAKAIETRELLLQHPYVDKLSRNEQYAIVKRIAEVIYNTDKPNWKLGQKWFEKMLAAATSREDKVFAAAALVQGAIATGNPDAIKKYMPYLVFDAPARSDIRLNLALLQAGDELVKKEHYSDAAVLYSMVLGRDAILDNLKRYIEIYKKRVARLSPDSQDAIDINGKIAILENQRTIVEGVQPYTADLMARSARNYMLTERDFESFWSYWQMIRTFPDHEKIEDFYFAAMVCAYKIGKFDEMFNLSGEYIKRFPDGSYVKDVQQQRAQYFLKKKDYPAFFSEAKKFISENPDEPPYSNNFIFMMGKTWLDLGKFTELTKTFEDYSKKNPDTAISEGCLYWAGMGYLASGDFKNAMRVLVKMTDDFPNGPYSEDGNYRRGVAAFGVGDFNVARDTLEDFVKKYPDSNLRGEVEFFLGDIYANVNQIDIAMKHYKEVESHTKNQSFIDNSYTQAAKLLHNDERYETEVGLMDIYLEKYPKGVCSEMNFLKAKALELMGQPADALKIYAEAIAKYGANPKDDGVDKMILDYNRMYVENIAKMKATVEFLKKLMSDKELLQNMVSVPAKRYRYFQDNPKIDRRLYEKFKRDKAFGPNLYNNKSNIQSLLDRYSTQIAQYPQGGTEKIFNEMIADAKSKKNNTLAYRLMAGLSAFGKPVNDVKMFNDDDIKAASVRTLVWMGIINEKYGAEPARKAFKEALERDEFEYLIDAMFGSASLEERLAKKGQGKWEEVLKLYSEIEKEFPSDPRAAEAVLRKADVLAKLGKRAEAEKCYEQVLRSPAWRGEAYAEALYRLGMISQHHNEIDKALMYYDRCYLGYSTCYKWTGKALLSAAKLLSARSEIDKAKAICDEFLENKLNEESPDFSEIKQFRQTL